MKESYSIAKRFSHLLEEWDWEKNKALGFDPYKLTYGSGKKAWWLCPKGHSYDAKIDNRTIKNHGCPFCSGKRVCEDNCLATTHPHIAKEWHPKMNGSLTPKDVTAGCKIKVYWLCPKGHSYDAKISNRTKKNPTGCPKCNQSRGETRIKEFLERFEIQSKTQQTFSDCRHIRLLPFDFFVFYPDGTLALVIEYQGEQHYKPIEYFGGKKEFEERKRNDKIKRNYCRTNKIPYLEIKYTEFDRIEEILTKKLTELGLLKLNKVT